MLCRLSASIVLLLSEIGISVVLVSRSLVAEMEAASMRSTMEVFPEGVRKLWNKWELRTSVLISLFLQILLIFAGSSRKRNISKRLTLVLWSAYLLADWVAVLALGILSNNLGETDCNNKSANHNGDLLAFWAPFLLLHLGGPDTITAFSLEDNELWLRHLLGLVFQFGIAVYVFIRSVPQTRLLLPGILMFFAGMTKYGERTWALRYASREHFRESMLTPPDPGPNYAKFMEEYASKIEAGLPADIEMQPEPDSHTPASYTEPEDIGDMDALTQAHRFFHTFKRLIVDLMLTFHDRNDSQSFFLKRKADDAFRVIEIELAFLYDVLYSKAVVVHSLAGYVFRSVSFSLISVSLMYFSLVVDRNGYLMTDVLITFVLLVGALCLEVFAIALMVLSSWTVAILKNHSYNRVPDIVFRVICIFQSPRRPRWSNSMAQYNLISHSLDNKNSWVKRITKRTVQKIQKFVGLEATKHIHVRDELKEFIFQELKQKSSSCKDGSSFRHFSTCRGEMALQKKGYRKEFGWSIEVELDESILLWHIATDLCYHEDKEKVSEQTKSDRKMSKELSNYMLYLLVFRPFMLTAGIGQIRFGDTCAEAKKFFRRRRSTQKKTRACKALLGVETEVQPILVKGDRSKSVLFNACRLAKQLLVLEKVEKRWKIISLVWVEMLSYAASQCRGNYHAQRLSAGGELLTHIWFLMAHLGIGEQYRIEAGHARAKLIVGK